MSRNRLVSKVCATPTRLVIISNPVYSQRRSWWSSETAPYPRQESPGQQDSACQMDTQSESPYQKRPQKLYCEEHTVDWQTPFWLDTLQTSQYSLPPTSVCPLALVLCTLGPSQTNPIILYHDGPLNIWTRWSWPPRAFSSQNIRSQITSPCGSHCQSFNVPNAKVTPRTENPSKVYG